MFWYKKSYEEKIKAKLLDLKKIKVGGISFVIKKINPLLDFSPDKIPQIFTDFVSRRPKPDDISQEEINRINESIKPILVAGIYRPILMPVDPKQKYKEEGLTLDDLFLDTEIAYTLFYEITNHSLAYFKGLKGLFFSIKIKLLLFILWLKNIRLNL